MRSNLILALLVLLSGFSALASADFQTSPVSTFTATFDTESEETLISIQVITTNDADLLDSLKQAKWNLTRNGAIVLSEISLCSVEMLNSECSSRWVNLSITPPPGVDESAVYELNGEIFAGSDSTTETTSEIYAVENLQAVYLNDITTISWDYPLGIPMNHSLAIYRHNEAATGDNWGSLTKELLQLGLSAGSTNFTIDYSEEDVETLYYYSVTIVYATSEDTRFLGSNTLSEPLVEDNTAPIFIGELSATFNSTTDTTLLDWGGGVDEAGLVINIYRSSMKMELLDELDQVATVEASHSNHELMIPFSEHRQSWYAITLEDQIGNEVLLLSESSPSAGPIIETTIDSSTITDLAAERLQNGDISLTWSDSTGNSDSIARVWRSISGPIEGFDDVEELPPTNVGAIAYTHDPLDSVQSAWYAITIEGAWGSQQIPWHDETLIPDVNSLSAPVDETEEVIVETEANFTVKIQAEGGQVWNINDGSKRILGVLEPGNIVWIWTTPEVHSITYGQENQTIGSPIGQNGSFALKVIQTDNYWILVQQGDQDIFFEVSWTVIEATEEPQIDDPEPKTTVEGHEPAQERTIAVYIIGTLMIILFGFLIVMLKQPEYLEEEE
jgi:hypothetical protein